MKGSAHTKRCPPSDDVDRLQADLKNQGVRFHYDRLERRAIQEARRIDPARETKSYIFKIGLFTALIAAFLAFVFSFFLPNRHIVSGEKIDLHISILDSEKIADDVKLTLKFVAKAETVTVDAGTKIDFYFEQKERSIFSYPLRFPHTMELQKGYPLLETLPIPRDVFARIKTLAVKSAALKMDGRLALKE